MIHQVAADLAGRIGDAATAVRHQQQFRRLHGMSRQNDDLRRHLIAAHGVVSRLAGIFQVADA